MAELEPVTEQNQRIGSLKDGRALAKFLIVAGLCAMLVWLSSHRVLPRMTAKVAFKQLLNGLTLGFMYVIIASGLSLIFGLMEVINFAHGALYMLGAYFGLTLFRATGDFWLSLLAAPVIVGAVGMGLEYTTFRPLYGRSPLYHILLTFGLVLVIGDATEMVWGKAYHLFPRPKGFEGMVGFLGITYPSYRLFVLAVGVAISVFFWFMLKRTGFGLIIRAGTYNREITSAFGIDISRYFTVVFGLGVAIAGAAGVLMAPILSVHPHMGDGIIITAFIVVVVGGLGSLSGAALAGILIGILESFSVILFPAFTGAMMYVVMVIVLLFRPQGLLGTEEIR
ncbi:MAG: branched-chain amino acid ABC transporter permease [Deltaproteobacteria bacterium]|nr:branched-chain amino acid ABC transporter permease [Deltaproteobacteria bacterium]